MSDSPLAIACAAGFGGDRTDAAAPLVETLIARGGPGALIFETLAERTLALAQLDRRRNPDSGYAPLLEPMLRPVLRSCVSISRANPLQMSMWKPSPSALMASPAPISPPWSTAPSKANWNRP